MRPVSPFLALPCELRDMVYEEYARTEGGYFFNFRTGKLTEHNNHRIDMSLMHTCRLCASELPAIVFKSVSSKELRARAGRFSENFALLERHEITILRRVSVLIKTQMLEDVLQYFPWYRPYIDLSQSNPVQSFHDSGLHHHTMREASSERRAFIRHLLLRAQEHHRFWEFASDLWRVEPNPVHVLALVLAPWAVTSNGDLERIEHALDQWLAGGKRRELCFSAASAAIQFLYSLPKATRVHIRNVLLLETEKAAARPECHAQGLIPFFNENTKLQVQRRGPLRKKVLTEFSHHIWPGAAFSKMSVQNIMQAVMPWVCEVAALRRFEMPANSFTLVIEDTDTSAQSLHVFKLIRQLMPQQVKFQEHRYANLVSLCLTLD